MWEVNKVSSIQFQDLESNLRPSLLLFSPPSHISTISNSGKISLWFASRTTFDFPSKQYQITVTNKPLIFKVSGGKLGNSISGIELKRIELVELVVLWTYHIFLFLSVMWVDCFFLHKSIISTVKNCWSKVTYFKDWTTHCYTIALNRFFSLWWKDCEDEDREYWFLILWEAGLAQILIPGYWPEDDIWWDNTDYEDQEDQHCNRES